MKTNTLTKLVLLFLISLPIALAAQKILDPIQNPPLYKTEFIHPDQGLSSPLLRCIYEDRYGFIWIGTQYGLDRYDGYSFTRMSNVVSEGVSTSMEWVWSIKEDHAGSLWVCSSKGLFRYDRKSNSFEMLLPNMKEPESADNTVYFMYQDSRGIYWLFTRGGLFSYDGDTKSFQGYKNDSITSDETILSNDFLYWQNQMRFCEDQSGKIWIGSEQGLKKYDHNLDQFTTYRHDPDDPGSISGDTIRCIVEDKSGILWIGAANRYDQLNSMKDTDSGVFTRYQHDPMNANSLVNQSIWSVYIDTDDNLWIGGRNGFSRYNYDTDDFINYSIPTYEVPGTPFNRNYIMSMKEDSKGNIWMIMIWRGLLSFYPSAEAISHYYWDPDIMNNLVPDFNTNTLFEDRSGSIWGSGQARSTRSDPILTQMVQYGWEFTSMDYLNLPHLFRENLIYSHILMLTSNPIVSSRIPGVNYGWELRTVAWER